MVYTASTDPACYPDTDILKNKAGVRDYDILADFEQAMFLTRSQEPWPKGSLDYNHYCAFHHHLFQDVYDWAGKIRTIRIGKAGNWFCFPEHIDQEMEKIFSNLADDNWFRNLNKDVFIRKAAHFLAEINAVHPFREGNGRTQMAFLIFLSEHVGFSFNDEKLAPDSMLTAMIKSFNGNEEPLVGLLQQLIFSK